MNIIKFHKILAYLVPITSIVGPFILIISEAFAISMTKNYNPLIRSMSDLALGPFGWIEKIGISGVTVSLLFLSFYYLFDPRTRRLTRQRFAGYLLLLTSISLIFVVVFNTDPVGIKRTLHGEIHIIAMTISSLVFPATCILLAMAFRKNREPRGIVLFSATIGLFALAFGIFRIPDLVQIWMGIYERSLAFVNLAWIIVIGITIGNRKILLKDY